MADFCFFKQKTAYEMRISDWSSDVCSSDLDRRDHCLHRRQPDGQLAGEMLDQDADEPLIGTEDRAVQHDRAVLLAVLGDIRCIEPFGQHAIRLDGADLPSATDRVREVPFQQIGSASCRERAWK